MVTDKDGVKLSLCISHFVFQISTLYMDKHSNKNRKIQEAYQYEGNKNI